MNMDGDCTEAKPCGSLYVANNLATDGQFGCDIIIKSESLNQETKQIQTNQRIVIKPVDGIDKVTLPLCNMTSGDDELYTFSVFSNPLTIRNFTFVVAADENSMPRFYSFFAASSSLTLVNCEFRRAEGEPNTQVNPLKYSMFHEFDSLYLVSCSFIGLTIANAPLVYSRQSFSLSSVQFINITREDDISNPRYLGIIHCFSKFTCGKNSLFLNCVCLNKSGKIIYFDGESGNISDTIFNNSEVMKTGGAIHMQKVSKEFNISGVIFDSCISNVENGGAVYCYDKCTVSCRNTTFLNCYCFNGNGGGISFMRRNSGSLKILETKFKNCEANKESFDNEDNNGKGGGIYLDINDLSSVPVLNYLMFGIGKEKNVAEYGDNLFLSSDTFSLVKNFYNNILKKQFEDSTFEGTAYMFYTSTDDILFSFSVFSDSEAIIGPEKLYVKSSSETDNTNCDNEENACKELSAAFNKVIMGNRNIYIIGEYSFDNKFDCDKDKCYIRTYDLDSKVKVSNQFINIENSYLTIENVPFKFINEYSIPYLLYVNNSLANLFLYNSTFEPYEGSFIFLIPSIIYNNGGYLYITGCSFKGKQYKKREFENIYFGCIHHNSGSFYLYNSNFSDCDGTEESDGGALYLFSGGVDIGGDDSDVIFKKCKGNCGGAIYIQLSENLNHFSINSITCGNNENKNIAYTNEGHNLYFYSSEISVDFITKEHFPFLENEEVSPDNYYCVLESNGDPPVYDMVEWFKNNSYIPTLYLNSTGVDSFTEDKPNNCLEMNSPCLTFVHVIDNANNYNSSNIIIIKNLNPNDICIINKNCIVSGDSIDAVLTVSNSCCFNIQGGITFRQLKVGFDNDEESTTLNYNPLFSVSNSLTLNDISFSNELGKELNKSIIDVNSGILEVNGCSFNHIHIYSSDGNILNLISIISGNPSLFNLCNTTFIDCQNPTGYGGALNLRIENSDICVGREGTSTEFVNCIANYGGAIYLKVEKKYTNVFFSNLTFSSNSATEDKGGNNIYFNSYDLYNTVTKNTFPYIDSLTEDDNNNFGVDKVNYKSRESLYKIIKEDHEKINNRYVGIEGEENNNCSEGYTCTKFEDAIKKPSMGILSVTIVDQVTLNRKYTLGFTEYNIVGEEKDSKIEVQKSSQLEISNNVSFNNLVFILSDYIINSLIMLKSGNLNLLEVSFSPTVEVEQTAVISPLISVDSVINSYIKIDNCHFKNIGMDGGNGVCIKALIDYYSILDICDTDFVECYCSNGYGGAIYVESNVTNGVNLNNVSFIKCGGDYGNGGGIYCSVGEGNKLTINGSKFIDCHVSYGNGGGIYADVKDGGSFIIDKNGETNSLIQGCSAVKGNNLTGKGGGIYAKVEDNIAGLVVNGITYGGSTSEDNNQGEGYDLYVETNDLLKVLDKLNIQIPENPLSVSDNEIIIEDKEKYPLLPYYVFSSITPPGIYISNLGLDDEYCGFPIFPCSSFLCAINRSSSEVKNVIIQGIANLDEDVNLNVSVTFKNTENETSEINALAWGIFNVKTSSTFSSLLFNVDESKRRSIFFVSSNLLTLSSVSFSPVAEISTLYSSLISVSSAGSLSLSLCKIENMNGDGVSGGAIYAEIGAEASVSVRGCSFINVQVSGGNGGGICVIVKEKGKLYIGSEKIGGGEDGEDVKGVQKGRNKNEENNEILTVFKGCSSKGNKKVNEGEEGGRGGAMYIKVEKGYGELKVENLEIGGEKEEEKNDGDEGNDLFLEVYDDKIINKDNFPFIFDKGEDYEGVWFIKEGEEKPSQYHIEKKEKNKTWVTVVIIVVVVVVVIIIIIIVIVVVVCIMKKKKNDNGEKEGEKEKEKEEKNNKDVEMEVDETFNQQ